MKNADITVLGNHERECLRIPLAEEDSGTVSHSEVLDVPNLLGPALGALGCSVSMVEELSAAVIIDRQLGLSRGEDLCPKADDAKVIL